MQPTAYAVIALLVIVLILLRRDRVKWSWMFFAVSQVFAVTSIAALTALGGASLTFPQAGVIALLFAAMLAVMVSDHEATRRVLSIHVVGLCLVVYTLVISIFGPRLFAGALDLVAMRPDMINGIAVPVPLAPKPSNITHAAYFAGTFLTAVAMSLVFARKLPESTFRNAVLAVGLLHAVFGLLDAVGVAAGGVRVLDFLRNADYAMVDQSIGEVARLSGTFPEPSAYAGFGVAFAVFATEDWFRGRRPRSGLIAAFLWTMIIASTSTTGYLAAAVYLVASLPRGLLSPGRFSIKLAVALVLAAGGLTALGIYLFDPIRFEAIKEFVLDLTIKKSASQSAMERASWAVQGWHAFVSSLGLGTGAGSFRSGSFAFAVLGSLGIIGTTLMLIFAAQVARVVMRPISSMQKSAAWAAMFGLVPALSSGVTADPGFVFAMFAGFALHPVMQRNPAVIQDDGSASSMLGERLTAYESRGRRSRPSHDIPGAA